MNHLLVCFAGLLFASAVIAYEPRECSKASDCGPNECCVLGMGTFSVPRCEPLGIAGEACLMDNPPEDKELYYPNKMVNVTGVYRITCPCEKSLECSEAECVSNALGKQ